MIFTFFTTSNSKHRILQEALWVLCTSKALSHTLSHLETNDQDYTIESFVFIAHYTVR